MENEITKDVLSNVYGYEDVKKELNTIRGWLSDEELKNNKKIMLPRGLIFYGRPGCGKTLILREFADSFKCPVFTIKGDTENICDEITSTFKKARAEKFAIVIIDEIDLLIGRNCRVERSLQQELDGIDNSGSYFVVATTNNYHDLDEALLRPGRFDRKIEIGYPNKESRKELFKKFIADLDVNDEEVDYDHVSKVCSRCSCAALKAVCNDAFLRCGKKFTTSDIESSYQRVVHDVYSEEKDKFKDFRVAIHECGHSLMAMNFSKNWIFYNAKFNTYGGLTEIQETDERVDTIEKREQNIMIGMAGYLAEEVYFGKHDVGSYEDYQKVYDYVERLVERVCKHGIQNCVPSFYHNDEDRHWTQKKIKINERLELRTIRKFEHKVKKFLKNNIKKLEQMANLMLKQGELTYKDVKSL